MAGKKTGETEVSPVSLVLVPGLKCSAVRCRTPLTSAQTYQAASSMQAGLHGLINKNIKPYAASNPVRDDNA